MVAKWFMFLSIFADKGPKLATPSRQHAELSRIASLLKLDIDYPEGWLSDNNAMCKKET